ncbi:uncharacterized protein LOC117500764 isoform X2 [Thalassophryne amazonica]|uniref:uncharacterized protein LOC117500764 isoform X2 n=1 Tax=Thalassophryne amazonica TaxID=390379 RepID=UPI0014713488|nr:uncharacterized protein LOC117500764 isoform X2 [Thalassophryne amazonica]
MTELGSFRQLERLSITSCATPLQSVDFLLLLSQQLKQLSICNVQIACPVSHLLSAIIALKRLTSLRFHHNGSLHVPAATGRRLFTSLPELRQLSWEMITYKTLPHDFFSSAHLQGTLKLSALELLNYDAVVTQETLQSLSDLRSLSIIHLYSVPGPTCHLQTWLTALPWLNSLSVHGGHPLGVYANFLPESLHSLTLCVDMKPEDLETVGQRTPHLQHLHLEPWTSICGLLSLLPQLFPQLRTLRIRHQHVSDSDFLSLQHLPHLRILEVLDSYHRPDPADPSCVVYELSQRLLRLISELQRLTNHRVCVTTARRRDPLTCQCF